MIEKQIKYFYSDVSPYPVQNVIETLLNYLSEQKLSQQNILFITLFIDSKRGGFSNQYKQIQKLFIEYEISVPYLVVAQAPFATDVAVEVILSNEDFDVIESSNQYKIIKTNYAYEIYASAFCEQKFDNIQKKTDFVFELLNDILSSNNFQINQIIRQWNYIEDILNISADGQHYQIFNDARSKYYNQTEWDYGYPAATGIGVTAGGVSINIHALKPINDVKTFPLKNPVQKDAHRYSVEVLVAVHKASKTTPKFERGNLIIYDKNNYDLLVSGTAAIIGEEAIEKSDAEQQTITTINNIEKLVEPENISKNFQKVLTFQKVVFSNVRVYIKNESDYEKVKQICEKHYQNIPIIYLHADICRFELLIEIEANCFALKI